MNYSIIVWLSCLLLAFSSVAKSGELTAEAKKLDVLSKRELKAGAKISKFSTRVLVRFNRGVDETKKLNAHKLAKATRIYQYKLVEGLELVIVPQGHAQAISEYKKNADIAYAHADRAIYIKETLPNDKYFPQMWNLKNSNGVDIKATQAWDIYRGAPNVIIADIDTGVDAAHIELSSNLVAGYDFYRNDDIPDDEHGHGTHTAGTMVALSNNSLGVTGVCWYCKVMPLKFIGPNGGSNADAIRAIEFAVANGVKVSNNSWGSTPGYDVSADVDYQALKDAIAAAGAKGHIFVAAAGNSTNNNDVLTTAAYPAAFNLPNEIAVAAVGSAGDLAYFSNYGLNSVHLGAPGVGIWSTWPNNYLSQLDGTSMAAPHVSAAVAMVQGAFPELNPSQVIQRILSTVTPLASLAGITKTGGMLNLYQALLGATYVPPVITICSPQNNQSFALGSSITFSAQAIDQKDGNLSNQLVWSSDKQGYLGAGASFVRNDLGAGKHVINVSVSNSQGFKALEKVNVWIDNHAPVLNILSPSPNYVFSLTEPVKLTASAFDPEEGDISNRIKWVMTVNNLLLQTGSSLELFPYSYKSDYKPVSYNLNVSVTDSAGAKVQTTISFSVMDLATVPPPVPNFSSISPVRIDTAGSPNKYTVGADIRWADVSGETKYEIERTSIDRKGIFVNPVIVGSPFINAVNFIDATTGVRSGTFGYRIRAINRAGASAWSPYFKVVLKL